MHLHSDTSEVENDVLSPQDDPPWTPTLGEQSTQISSHPGLNNSQTSEDYSTTSFEDDLLPNTDLSEGEGTTRPPPLLINPSAKPESANENILTSPPSPRHDQTSDDNPISSVFHMGTLTTSRPTYLSPSATHQFFDVPTTLSFSPDQRRSSLPGPVPCYRCGGFHAIKDCPFATSRNLNVAARRSSVHALPGEVFKDGSVSV